jgi:Flp pilus assembly secretin CpaC
MFRPSAFVATILIAATAVPAMASERLQVSVDHARILKIDRPAASVIIGNPSIVDITVHDSQTLVLTGRSFGITNLVVLDNDGASIIDEEVAVRAVETGTIRVYRQAERTTFACLPTCEPTVTIGDTPSAFSAAAEQFNTRQSISAGTDK